MDDNSVDSGLNRRQVLRAAAYVAPVVTLIALTPARAEAVSGPSGAGGGQVSGNGSVSGHGAGTAAGKPGQLPFTGVASGRMLEVGAAAVAVGAASMVAGRKKQMSGAQADAASNSSPAAESGSE